MKSYSKHFGFFRNKAVTGEIVSLDPVKDHCRIVHLMTGYEFPWDIVRALEVALMRTFCSPRISGLLHRTGEFRKHGQKRYDDTALLVAEFMQNGYDSEKGKFAIQHMNKIHGFYKIENDDFLFVLSTFIFLPIQWIDAYGWRKTTENERQALFYFFKEVGERMHIKSIPCSLAEFEKFVHEYETENFIYEATNHAVGNATVNIVKGWMPFFAKPFVLPVMKCLLDEKMLRALGYSFPASFLKATVKTAMRLRAVGLRKITFRKYPSFVTTEYNRTYPKGYNIKRLGPANLIKKLQQQ
ncbi:MAG TPA: oxygenase MpaB family protein [Chitinophagaceae bacterium]